ncbi:hypothetical protein [Phenylobacterium kunshanense]|uniref:Uncharacterized protein n=1 Tax=Phenylobacterium kunshanense TaxID=1445034 RepID=A0A328BPB4_9CAUL|nr:hypothetical protein [Phenylobacterium kunshanense]RAK69142.1 hypothetical protein DJ019_03820 [Phenylobacterium kunshanense]
MEERSFRQDLTGSDESLEDLLSRLKALPSRPKARPGRYPPPEWGHFVTSRRPPGGAGGAEAPVPVERPAADCYAS